MCGRQRIEPLSSRAMSKLQAQLNQLAQNFATSLLDAVRGSPLQELLGDGRAERRSPRFDGSPRANRSSGRLSRRSAEDIAKALEKVVSLVKKHGGGLRAEQIRHALGLQAKEMPRILQEGLSTKKLKSKGQRRATTYLSK
jgi:hypothetical protein